MENLRVLSALAFGDFVIDYYFLIESKKSGVIYCPVYLKPLVVAMNALNSTYFLDEKQLNIPPSVFDFKKSSIRLILRDYLNLRKSINKIPGELIIPHYNLRWKAIFFPRKCITVCNNNIYYSYRSFYNLDKATNININIKSNIVYIFPESRQINKIIPPELSLQLISLIKTSGLTCKLVVLKNSNYKSNSEIDTIYIDKFTELIKMIDSSCFIISADSLPVHLAYLMKRVTYIFSPIMNYKMFPDLVIENETWSLFDYGIKNFESWFKTINVK